MLSQFSLWIGKKSYTERYLLCYFWESLNENWGMQLLSVYTSDIFPKGNLS